MKVVVTGALGHIGSNLIRHLSQAFDRPEIVLWDDLSTQRYCSVFVLPQKASYRLFDKRVQDAVAEEILREADRVVHLAAITDAAGTADKPMLVQENNLGATEIISRAC